MQLILMCVISIIFLGFMCLILRKKDRMRAAAIREIPNILKSSGKLNTLDIKQKLYAQGINVSICELCDLLIVLEESRAVECLAIPMYDGDKIISHGEYKVRRDSFDDYLSTTPRVTHAAK